MNNAGISTIETGFAPLWSEFFHVYTNILCIVGYYYNGVLTKGRRDQCKSYSEVTAISTRMNAVDIITVVIPRHIHL